MLPICHIFRTGLCLWLAVQLALPVGTGAQTRGLQVEALRERATLWVLAIGVSQYADGRINLKYADHDAEQIAQLLATQEGVLFRKVFTRILVNETATREEILKAMDEFLGQAAPEDVVVVFLAGHGVSNPQTGTYFFLPHDAGMKTLTYHGIPLYALQEMCEQLSSHTNKLVLLLDTCHAGAMRIGRRGLMWERDLGQLLAESLDKASGQYVLSASKPGEDSFEDASWKLEDSDKGHGAFTYSLLRGLKGAAADSNKVVWLSDLFGHVSKEVPILTRDEQHPFAQIRGVNLPLFVLSEISLLPELIPLAPPPPPPPAPRRKWLWGILAAAATGSAAMWLKNGSSSDPEPIAPPPDHPIIPSVQ